ncbi:MAG: DUF839 domain-containing protein [Burkholderiales bacterium]|nr:DUF839 domain-containing protein [Nitrosomonas sp.]MCP5276144.1 DUF839 domain-containing protein [Burkholderiales bacterium]
MLKKIIIAAALIVMSGAAYASGPYFEPLTEPNTAADATSFNNNPFTLPPNFSQEFVASRTSLAADFAAKGEVYPATFGNWDMLDFGGNNAEYIFIPHEVGDGAGLTRINRDTGEAVVLLQGIPANPFDSDPSDGWDHQNDNFGALDPAKSTPAGTLVVAEEWAGNGRIFELLNPTTATSPADANWRWLTSIPSVSHEGIQFDNAGNMYFVDENSSGSIYRFEPKNPNELSKGRTSVLVVNGGGVDSVAGPAQWVPITDIDSNAVTTADPFDYSNRGGRAAADEVGGTGYNRPEDLTVVTLASGNQAIIFTATGEDAGYSVELIDEINAVVREFFNSQVTPDVLGNNPVGNGGEDASVYGLNNPDNLAADVAGNIFIIEDQDPGDIWMAIDQDNDGVTESVALFASLGNYGSEPTGFKNDPRDPFTWYVNVQHPSTHGNNDALWIIKHDIADLCGCQSSKNHGAYVSCVAHAAKDLGINGSIKSALTNVAAKSSCGK